MKAVLGLGSNLGNREEALAGAITQLEKLEGTELLALSNVYETVPFDVPSPQGDYLNCCVLIDTSLSPMELLERCLEIEARLGRVRLEHHGSRTIDIDLLLYQGFSSAAPRLTVPHPGILERAFVMVPLSDLFPTKTALGLDFSEAYQAVDKTAVRLYK